MMKPSKYLFKLTAEHSKPTTAVRFNSSSHQISHLQHTPYDSLPQFLPLDLQAKVTKAQFDCTESLSKFDKSSELLSHYVPDPARPAFIALKCFNIEMNKIQSSNSSIPSSFASLSPFNLLDLKFKFWQDNLHKLSTNQMIAGGEPIALILQDSTLKDLNVSIEYLQTFISNRKLFLKNPTFHTVDDICSYGEGTYSQLNYFVQSLLLSQTISPSAIALVENSSKIQSLITDIAAHIGQANAIATMVTGLSYYAKKDQITVPIALLSKHDLSEEQVLRLCQGYIEPKGKDFDATTSKLKDVVFDTCIAANDHVLLARQKFSDLQLEISSVLSHTDDQLLLTQSANWLHQVPDAIFVPFMSILPIELYLSKLEQYDFDVFNKNLVVKDWKLLWKSYWSYNGRRI